MEYKNRGLGEWSKWTTNSFSVPLKSVRVDVHEDAELLPGRSSRGCGGRHLPSTRSAARHLRVRADRGWREGARGLGVWLRRVAPQVRVHFR